MVTLNAVVKKLEPLLNGILEDVYRLHGFSHKDLERDINCVRHRSRAEGPSFIFVTLPKLGDHLITSLESDFFKPSLSFKRKGKSNLPCFMHRFFKEVFDDNGFPSGGSGAGEAIRSIRQVCEVFKKFEGVCNKSDDMFWSDYKQIDSSLPENDTPLSVQQTSDIYYAKSIALSLVEDFSVTQLDFVLQFGPGATAQGHKPWTKPIMSTYHPELDDIYPQCDLFYYNDVHFVEVNNFFDLPIDKGGTSKICFVPKTTTKKRTIAIEPSEKMVYQQILRRWLYDAIPRKSCGRVQFKDQTQNQKLVRKSSVDKKLSTIDLSSASDRVSLYLVRLLFEDNPSFLEYLLKARCTKCSGFSEEINLRKFASQGNALTFPVEAMVFYSLLQGRHTGVFGSISHDIYVYGDDIIVPTYFYQEAIEVLESFWLKVNWDKSFSKSHFRESCGVDCFNGYECQPLRLKTIHNHNCEATDISSVLEFSDNLFLSGYWKASEVLIQSLPKRFRRGLKGLADDGLLPSYPLKVNNTRFIRYNYDLQRYEMKTEVLRSKVIVRNNINTLHMKFIDMIDADYNDILLPFTYTPRYTAYIKSTWLSQ